MRYTDIGRRTFRPRTGGRGSDRDTPGPLCAQNGMRLTRVEISRDGLARPRGRYVTLETPSLSLLDERDTAVIELAAEELRALLPPEGPVLVLGVGNRRVTADALGAPDGAACAGDHGGPAIRCRCGGSGRWRRWPRGVSQSAGLSLQELAQALVGAVRPTALLCVDSLCSSEPQRLGRTIQFSDTGLAPADPGSSRHLDAAGLGVPVVAAGVPTLMEAAEGRDLVGSAPRPGQRHRPWGGFAGGGHQPGPAAPPHRQPAVLAGQPGINRLPLAHIPVYIMQGREVRPWAPRRESSAAGGPKGSGTGRAAVGGRRSDAGPGPLGQRAGPGAGRRPGGAGARPAHRPGPGRRPAGPRLQRGGGKQPGPRRFQPGGRRRRHPVLPGGAAARQRHARRRPGGGGDGLWPGAAGEKYIACAAGTIKNNTSVPSAEVAAEIQNPLPFQIQLNSPRTPGADHAPPTPPSATG